MRSSCRPSSFLLLFPEIQPAPHWAVIVRPLLRHDVLEPGYHKGLSDLLQRLLHGSSYCRGSLDHLPRLSFDHQRLRDHLYLFAPDKVLHGLQANGRQ